MSDKNAGLAERLRDWATAEMFKGKNMPPVEESDLWKAADLIESLTTTRQTADETIAKWRTACEANAAQTLDMGREIDALKHDLDSCRDSLNKTVAHNEELYLARQAADERLADAVEAVLRVQKNAPLDSTDLDERVKYYASGWINGCSAAASAIRALALSPAPQDRSPLEALTDLVREIDIGIKHVPHSEALIRAREAIAPTPQSPAPTARPTELDNLVEDLWLYGDEIYEKYSGVIGDKILKAASEIVALRNELEALMTTDAPAPTAELRQRARQMLKGVDQWLSRGGEDAVLAAVVSFAEAEAKLLARPDGEGEGEPVAWLHEMTFETGEVAQSVTLSPQHEWGEPGKDYSAEYAVTTTPLYAKPDGEAVRAEIVRFIDDYFGSVAFRDFCMAIPERGLAINLSAMFKREMRNLAEAIESGDFRQSGSLGKAMT